MNCEVYTELGRAVTLFRNKANTADCILLFNDREQETGSIQIHICRHDLLQLAETIQKFLCVDETKKEKKRTKPECLQPRIKEEKGCVSECWHFKNCPIRQTNANQETKKVET